MKELINYTLADEMKAAPQKQKVKLLFEFMEDHGQSFYDELVTQLEHALQCAALAMNNDACDTLITSALLHDIGHLILDEHNADVAFLDTDLNHEEIGAEYLKPFFSDTVTTPIRLHVPAKRYLCAIDSTYYDDLSDASKKSLRLQGGPMSDKERNAFEQIQYYQHAVTLRKWDDCAKIKGLETSTIHIYKEIVQRCLL